MIEPMAAVSAAVEPEIPEKKISETIETMPRPFLKCPTKAWARLTSLNEIPPVSIKDPAKMKKGTARRGKESDPVKIFCGTITRGMVPLMRRPRTEANPMLNAMGMFRATKAIKVMLRIKPMGNPAQQPIRNIGIVEWWE
jgi:hypothetical protein